MRAACCFRGDRVTSQGQRFRRRALRRGYKVDEVDSFLDRVEATLAGDPVAGPVTAQEVHDVVFRVRFGGYDEWQVDLHLDRVERQLAELEEHGGAGGRVPEARTGEMRGMADRMPPPVERMPPPVERMPPPVERMPPPVERMPQMDRMPPPVERIPQERMPPPVQVPPAGPPPGRPPMGMPAPAAAPREPGYGRYDEPAFDTGGYEQGRHGRADMTTELRMPPD